RQSVPRHLAHVPPLLRAQDDVRESCGRVRCLSRRLRDGRRAVRGADADPDGQGAALSGRPVQLGVLGRAARLVQRRPTRGGDDRICLGSGDDILLAGDGNDSIDGGADTDTDLYFTATGPVQVDLESGVATGDGRDTLRGIENVGGSNFNDTLKGDANMNVL